MRESFSSGHRAASSHYERRATPRYRARGRAFYVPVRKLLNPPVYVTLVDISRDGVSFLTDSTDLVIGNRLLLEMQPNAGADHPLIFEAEVRQVTTDQESGLLHVECAWQKRLGYLDVMRFT